jgi:hypothetical protein
MIRAVAATFALVATVVATGVAAQSGGPLHLECAGPFGAGADEAALARVFGAGNISAEVIDGPEGTVLDATLVYPADPDRRLIVLWHDEFARARPAAIIIRDESQWIGPGGVRRGATIDEVEAINGAPFVILGFGWDYGGAASFPSGVLSELPGGCSLSLSFTLDWEREYGPEFDAIMGDQAVSSDNPVMRRAAPTVSEIAVGYPQ